MNLFWKRIIRTAKFESNMANARAQFKAYRKTKKSEDLADYIELDEIDFSKARAQFKNKKEYKASEIYDKEVRYKKLKRDTDINAYLKIEGKAKTEDFHFQERFTQSYYEEFSGNDLDTNRWKSAYRWSHDSIGANYSDPEDFQAYANGENTEVLNGTLHIHTKRKSIEGRVWDAKKGFYTKEFDYTSDLISGEDLMGEAGCILIKFKFESENKNVHHYIRAYDEDNNRCMTIIESLDKRKFRVGRSVRNNPRATSFATFSGVNLNKDYHIIELEWNSEIVSWRLNGYLLYQLDRIPAPKPLHVVMGSKAVGSPAGEGKLMVDYMRFFDERNGKMLKTK